MTRPLVSVLVPAFNAARYLREAVDSILGQSYPNVEVLLLDDASSDETGSIAATYGGRIRYVRQPKNLGIYDNVNVGIGLARGDFIATYHADDFYSPTIVSTQVEFFELHPDVGAVFCSDIFVDAAGREYGRLRLPDEVRGERPLDYATVLNGVLTYKNRFLVCPSAMVRASVHQAVGVYQQSLYGIASDLDMWLRIARRYPIAVLESHLMSYRHFHGNASQRYDELRTAPEAFFTVMDAILSRDVGVATRQALTNYEAHRSEDRIMAAISHYIKEEIGESRASLRAVRLRPLLRARAVQRGRLLILYFSLVLLTRIRRSELLARFFKNRWHLKRPPAAPPSQ
jgi:glycosyltransferase involved in cell wall biosynthesis